MSSYPTGAQSFREIREEKCLYADKTEYIHRLLMDGRFFCLFRPRGFGKTLFTGALKELFEGNSDIFQGLFIGGTGYDFTRYPVISLDLGAFDSASPAILKEEISWELKRMAFREELFIKGASPGTILSWLIDALELKYRRKVVILIDEVDSPISSKISDPELAEGNAKAISAFLSPLAAKRDKIRFCFATGELRHEEAFGEKLNALFKDVSLSSRYGGILGITKEEFFNLFKEPLSEVLDVLRSDGSVSEKSKPEDLKNEIVRWYGGYSFDGELMVIDPESLMTFLENSAFDHYFADIRLNPSFVSLAIKDLNYLFPERNLSYDRKTLRTVKSLLGPSPSLLTQKGVFSISGGKRDLGVLEHTLSFPNFDAERSFHLAALEKLTGVDGPRSKAFLREFEAAAKDGPPEAISLALKNYLLKCRFEDKFAEIGLICAAERGLFREGEKEDDPFGRKEGEEGLAPSPESSGPGGSSSGGSSSGGRKESKARLLKEDEAILRKLRERALMEGYRILDLKIVKVLSLILSLSGFKLRNDPEDELSVQGFLKRAGDKTVILNLSYLKGGFSLPLGGRKRLLNEALESALEKVGEIKESQSSLVPQEIREIFLFLTGGSETLAGVFSRQGGFFWRPLSKAPGSSS
jgi:hypothetical protein